jgi:CRP/FNR family transcriptional regulator, cyclic AMP receptor protein
VTIAEENIGLSVRLRAIAVGIAGGQRPTVVSASRRVQRDDQLFNSSEKRLARLLLLMANFGTEGRPEPVLAKINQTTLAEMIGTTRSRVSHFMNKFRKLGFIDYNGDLQVHNSLLNIILHDDPAIRMGTPDNGG